jgi:hypothetical protein
VDVQALPETARQVFSASVASDAQAYLDGKMTPAEFAGSIWYAAGTAALALDGDGRSRWLEQWVRFAHWDDELDAVYLAAASESAQAVRVRIADELRQEATALLTPSAE